MHLALAKWLSFLFHGPAWLTFVVMGAAAGGFAVSTLDLLVFFGANAKLISTYGLMALAEGGLLQLGELIGWGYLGVACYVVFKGCLYGLLERVPGGAHGRAESRQENTP